MFRICSARSRSISFISPPPLVSIVSGEFFPDRNDSNSSTSVVVVVVVVVVCIGAIKSSISESSSPVSIDGISGHNSSTLTVCLCASSSGNTDTFEVENTEDNEVTDVEEDELDAEEDEDEPDDEDDDDDDEKTDDELEDDEAFEMEDEVDAERDLGTLVSVTICVARSLAVSGIDSMVSQPRVTTGPANLAVSTNSAANAASSANAVVPGNEDSGNEVSGNDVSTNVVSTNAVCSNAFVSANSMAEVASDGTESDGATSDDGSPCDDAGCDDDDTSNLDTGDRSNVLAIHFDGSVFSVIIGPSPATTTDDSPTSIFSIRAAVSPPATALVSHSDAVATLSLSTPWSRDSSLA